MAQVEACAAGVGGKAVVAPALLDEVTGLVEWPVAFAEIRAALSGGAAGGADLIHG